MLLPLLLVRCERSATELIAAASAPIEPLRAPDDDDPAPEEEPPPPCAGTPFTVEQYGHWTRCIAPGSAVVKMPWQW